MTQAVSSLNLEHESRLANISRAGWRPLVEAAVSVGGNSEATHEITRSEARRVLLLTTDGKTDLRVDINETATATSLPLLPNEYVILQVEQGDTVHLFNTTGGALTVYIVELR